MTIEFDWLELPMLRFEMGTDDTDAPFDEKPRRSVTIGSIAISRHPISVGEWRTFVEATSYRTVAESEGTSFASCIAPGDPVTGLDWWTIGQGDHTGAVTHLAWFDVWEFCRWANVRLPTEAEWARAACDGGIAIGALWQWTDDWYSDHFHRNDHRVNPTGPNSGQQRVARGGAARTTARLGVLPDLSAGDLGFRVVRRRS